MELLSIIAIIVIISKIMNKAGEAASRVERCGQPQNVWDQVADQVKSGRSQNEQWKNAARDNIEKARKRATLAYEQMTLQQAAKEQRTRQNEAYQQSMQHRQQENKSAMQQVYAGRMEARNTSILERAVKNAEEDKVDVTLETMEREHNHSERVSPAEHYHPEDVMPENMLGTIEDLMVKGYDGNLCFERDFVGEAMDMISRFTVPSDVPDFSKHDVA